MYDTYSLHDSTVRLVGKTFSTCRAAVCFAVALRFNSSTINVSWIAPSSLYQLWKLLLLYFDKRFADCLKENGVLDAYCSVDPYDDCFDARGTWEENEIKIEGGAAHPLSGINF